MDQELIHQAGQLLESKQLRPTPIRLSVLSVLLERQEPLSQEQIAEAVSDCAPNKVTIYRTLSSLVESGLIHEALVRDRVQLYEMGHHCTQHLCHPHFTCTRCRKTVCLPGNNTVEITLPKGFVLQRQQLQIDGLCPQCNQTHYETN